MNLDIHIDKKYNRKVVGVYNDFDKMIEEIKKNMSLLVS